MHTTTSIISTKNRFSTLVNFHLPIPPLLVYKIILTIPTNAPLIYTSAILHPTIFTKNVFPTSTISPFQLRQGNRELGSLVRTGTVLISPFFLKVWTVITGLTITDSLSLRLRKLVY